MKWTLHRIFPIYYWTLCFYRWCSSPWHLRRTLFFYWKSSSSLLVFGCLQSCSSKLIHWALIPSWGFPLTFCTSMHQISIFHIFYHMPYNKHLMRRHSIQNFDHLLFISISWGSFCSCKVFPQSGLWQPVTFRFFLFFLDTLCFWESFCSSCHFPSFILRLQPLNS